jgi:DNA-binding MarR family transcriptional regulator
MKNKYVGYLIVGVTAIFSFVVISFNYALNNIVNTSCTHGIACPMHATVLTQEIISYSLMALLFIVGLFMIFFMKDEQTTIIKHENVKNELTPEEKKEKLNNLDEEERKIMDIILRENGSKYQSDLIKETNLTKVKVTRILDKLEGRNLIERKRRGMTNIVISR